ncbi:MmcQ/YjbR family DNA-binding protein [Actinomycetospora termitidis]|uniref:MmcQ/YjbR family DNA-binding protein n=1 Tax=Actinomycetospora termitidis TaxID=3053470 RepID=A0ABT7MBZ1_9PSEU|nr:MmcQ/YjbR family DNA-binding protein [Actinomycetospora sp. Odt1-22]MDL5158182.1 MmcQ/YjbR family DNA-binding protein [Actinomycetospora sp. Odt1-22]
MATWDDVRRHALALPEVEELPTFGGASSWKVKKKLFVWERPLRRGDLADLGWSEQPGPVLGARVPDLGAKEALVAEESGFYFTTPHFDGHASVLVHLDAVPDDELAELVTEAWYAAAPAMVLRRHPRDPA